MTILLMLDERRQERNHQNLLIRNHQNLLMFHTHEREYRYEERGNTFFLKCWHDGNETSQRGALDERPEWLDRIITAAVVGGHLRRIPQPPPDALVWFTTDLDNNLLTFLELS